MPKPPMPPAVRKMLEQANPAVIATLRPDGQPVSVATWYVMDGDRILVNMDEGRKRLDHLQADPRVSVTVLDKLGWYSHVSMQGRVVDVRPDEGMVDIDRISRHYTERPYSNRTRGRVSAWIEIDRWHGWGDLPNEG